MATQPISACSKLAVNGDFVSQIAALLFLCTLTTRRRHFLWITGLVAFSAHGCLECKYWLVSTCITGNVFKSCHAFSSSNTDSESWGLRSWAPLVFFLNIFILNMWTCLVVWMITVRIKFVKITADSGIRTVGLLVAVPVVIGDPGPSSKLFSSSSGTKSPAIVF